ncbi:MAG: hypothetical protein ACTSO9_17495, partial [Candidatus Helarchaeota archaeon]
SWKGLFFVLNICGIILAVVGILLATITYDNLITLANSSYFFIFIQGFVEIWINILFFFANIFPLSLDIVAIILSVEAAISIISLVLLLDFSQVVKWKFRFLIFSGIFNVVLICIGLGIFDTVLMHAKIDWLLGTFFLTPLSSLTGSIPLIIGVTLMGINIYIFFSLKKTKNY